MRSNIRFSELRLTIGGDPDDGPPGGLRLLKGDEG